MLRLAVRTSLLPLSLLTPLLLLPAPALAQPAPTPPPTEAAPLDPARVALAHTTVDAIFPAGTYARLMSGMSGGFLSKIVESVGAVPLAELAGMSGRKPEELQKLGKTSLNDIMEIIDPAYRQRTQAAMNIMMPAMAKAMGDLEPEIRDGMAEAYARKFTAEQLADMNRFFATPSGQAYAANVMTIQMDPAVMNRMTSAVPKFMQQFTQAMPALGKQIDEATAQLPKPRGYKDLSPAERKKLATLLGVSDATLAAQAAKKTTAKP